MTGRTYRLDPPDRTGWLFGLDGPQVITVGAGVILGTLLLSRGVPAPAAFAVIVVAGAAGLSRFGGTTALELAAVAARRLHVARQRTWFAPLPMLDTHRSLPRVLDGQRLLVVEPDTHKWPARTTAIAVIEDGYAHTLAVTIRATGRQFGLLERDDQDRLLALWGDALAPFCRERSPVLQLRWCEWAAPCGVDDHQAWLDEHTDPAERDTAARRSYAELLCNAGPVAVRHQTMLTIIIDANRVSVDARHKGDRTAAAIEVLLRETRLLAARLQSANLTVDGPLDPGEFTAIVRRRLDPTAGTHLDTRTRSLAQRTGRATLAAAGPLATRTHWDRWDVDDCHHRCLYVADYPRTAIPAHWLGPVLLATGIVRAIAVTYEPVPPSASRRAVSRHAAKVEADMQQRADKGFRVGAAHHSTAQAIAAREQELVAGYPELTFTAVIAVAAATVEQLEADCTRLVHVAAAAGLDLRPLNGRHDQGVVATLPLARGVRHRPPR